MSAAGVRESQCILGAPVVEHPQVVSVVRARNAAAGMFSTVESCRYSPTFSPRSSIVPQLKPGGRRCCPAWASSSPAPSWW